MTHLSMQVTGETEKGPLSKVFHSISWHLDVAMTFVLFDGV